MRDRYVVRPCDSDTLEAAGESPKGWVRTWDVVLVTAADRDRARRTGEPVEELGTIVYADLPTRAQARAEAARLNRGGIAHGAVS